MITGLVLGAISHIEAREPAAGKAGKFMGASFVSNQPGVGKKYSVRLSNYRGFKTNSLPPEGFVARATMVITKGDGQVVNRALSQRNNMIPTAVFEPLQVCVKNADGKPAANVRVKFRVYERSRTGVQAIQISPSGNPVVYVMTDKRGRATLNLMAGPTIQGTPVSDWGKHYKSVLVYYADGPFPVIATHGDIKVVFKLKAGGA